VTARSRKDLLCSDEHLGAAGDGLPLRAESAHPAGATRRSSKVASASQMPALCKHESSRAVGDGRAAVLGHDQSRHVTSRRDGSEHLDARRALLIHASSGYE
jgi:hypothetical protein